jgi:hypothetical protein
VFLLPIAASLLVAAVRWPIGSPPGTTDRRRVTTYLLAFAGMCVIAAVVVEALYFFPSDPFLYLAGMRKLNADHLVGHDAYFNGELARRFYSYFVAAYLLKEPLASVVLAGAGLVLLLRNQTTPALTKLFLLVTPAAFLVINTLLADDLGIRYIIPALPFAYLLGGLALSSLLEGRLAWGRPAAAMLCAWLVVAAAGIYPDHLSYFNEAACLPESSSEIGWDGGSRCGPQWMDDSNVDWGQGIKQLRAWAEQHANGRTLQLVYFGSFPPESYGLACERFDAKALMTKPPAGLYALSANYVGRIPAVVASVAAGGSSWISQTTPIAIVGHAFYIYDIH